jgi:hypothetical protein
LLLGQVIEATVISTIDGVAAGVLAIVKSVSAVVEFLVTEKNVVCEFSGLAFTVMVTPFAGRVEVIEILKGKLGPGAGGSVVFTAGLVVTCNADSVAHSAGSFFFLHSDITTSASNTTRLKTRFFFIYQGIEFNRVSEIQP